MDDYSTLSPRQKEIATLVATGASNKEIARQLAISEKTVKNILTQVFVKTSTQSRTELAVHWVQSHNYLPTPLGQGALIV
jgi:DNA-binding NarL/FixJ family response regulator